MIRLRDDPQRNGCGRDTDGDADEGVGEPEDGLPPGVVRADACQTITTAVVIAAVIESPGRPASVTARTLSPIRRAMAQAWKGRKIR